MEKLGINKKMEPQTIRERGFSMIELLVVLAILLIVFGVVVSGITQLVSRSNAENAKLDIHQEAREFMDQGVRDLHQAGYPGAIMYDPSVFAGPVANDRRVAVGLVSVSPNQIQFESDTDGNGQVQEIYIQLVAAGPGGTCPCTLHRGSASKVDGVAPLAQPAPTVFTELSHVVNSNAVYQISGSTPSGALNDTAYSAYKAAPVFSAFDKAGNAVPLPIDVNTAGPPAITDIKTINLTVNLLSPYSDLQAQTAPVVSMTAVARVND